MDKTINNIEAGTPPILLKTFSPNARMLLLNRPERCNSFSELMLEQLDRYLLELEADPQCSVLVLSGSGSFFCSGLDLKEAFYSGEGAHEMASKVIRILYRLRTMSKIVVTLAQKGAFGGGAGLIAVSDYVIATDDFHLGFPELRRGLAPALLHPFLCRKLSPTVLARLVLTGAPIDALEAKNSQLIHQTVPNETLIESGKTLVQEIAKGDPLLFARSKRQIIETLIPPLEELDAALAEHWASWQSERAQEGIRAFLEKRKPFWQV